MKRSILTLMAMAAFMVMTTAQVRTAPPSPGAKISQRVGLTDVMIDYSRPGMKNRKIMGGLVPFGEVWRTGANQATKISFSEDVTLGGQELKKGDYAILTKPGATEWTVMAFKHTSGNWGAYIEDGVEPVATFTAKSGKTAGKVESFTIAVNNLSNDKATIDISWENTLVSIPLAVHTDKQTMASIEKTMGGPGNNDFYQAATYYHESGKDVNKALEYINKATAMGEPQYWQMRRKSLILADLGKMDEAIVAAKSSMALAETAGNKQYVKFNQDAIAEWSGKAGKMKKSKSMKK